VGVESVGVRINLKVYYIVILVLKEKEQKKNNQMKLYKDLTKRQKSIFNRIENIFTLTYGVTLKDLVIVLETLLNKHRRNVKKDYAIKEQMLLTKEIKDIKGQIIISPTPVDSINSFWNYFQENKKK